ncbi:MAG: UDP-N-acetylglucosamine 1-carboxyvinyltransferase [Christensenellaceae bacterium]
MKYEIIGGNKLFGEVKIQSAKNSVLLILVASILSNGGVYINNTPKIYDVLCMAKILRSLGAKVIFDEDGIYIDASRLKTTVMPKKLTNNIRASFFMVGPLLAKYKCATISKPGGCKIGARPVDIHIEAFKKMNVNCTSDGENMNFFTTGLKGANIRLKYPSVGATENIIMAASLAEGCTRIENAAREPEIKDLQNFINLLGGRVFGAGTDVIEVYGVNKLFGCEFTPISDRIETGTFISAVCMCGGDVMLSNANYQNILPLIKKIENNTCKITYDNVNIYIQANNKLNGLGKIVTMPYPGFPTDLQPIVVALASTLNGYTEVKETVFESRFRYVDELIKMGADLKVADNTVFCHGAPLHGAKVYAPDLRGGASLCLAGLAAEGKTEVYDVCHIERGYQDFDLKLQKIGVIINKR